MLKSKWGRTKETAGKRTETRRNGKWGHGKGFRLEALETRALMTADPGWAFGLGGLTTAQPSNGVSESAVVVGPDDHIYVTGSFNGTIDLDPSPGVTQFTTHLNSQDGFIAKYTQQGNLVWANNFGRIFSEESGYVGHEIARDIEFDAAGNMYIMGISNSLAPQFDNITLANEGHFDPFVAKIEATNGSFQWVRRVGGAENDLAYNIAVNAAGDVYMAGHFDGTIDADPDPGATHSLTSAGETDALIWKLDTNGDFQWARQLGGTSNDTGHRVVLGEDGFVYAGGTFRDTVDFGNPGNPMLLTNGSGTVTSNSYIVKIDEVTGESVWARRIGDEYRTSGVHMAADGEGILYVAGGFENTLSFGEGGPTFESAGLLDVYVSRWDANGNFTWAKQFGGTGNEGQGHTMTVDPAGNPMFSLDFEGTIDVDPGAGTVNLTSAGMTDSAVIKLSSDGELDWVRQISGPGTTSTEGIHEDANGNIVLTGVYQDSVTLPTNDTLTRSGYGNYLVKLAPAAPTKFFIVDNTANQTYEFDTLGNKQDLTNLVSANSSPKGAASNIAGDRVWVIDANKKVYVYDNGGALLGSWTANGLSAPSGITTNGTDIWISDSSADRVYKYTNAASRLSGSQSAASNFKLNSQNKNPTDLVTNGSNIWVIDDASTNKVFRYSMTGSLQGSWTVDSRNTAPTGITLDPSGGNTLWILDNGRDQVFEYAGATTRTSGSQGGAIVASIGFGNLDLQGIADPPPSGEAGQAGNTSGAAFATAIQEISAEVSFPQGEQDAAAPVAVNKINFRSRVPSVVEERTFYESNVFHSHREAAALTDLALTELEEALA